MGAPKSTTSVSFGADNLFQGAHESSRVGDSGPYVISLSSSSAPISLPHNGIALPQNTRLYQIRQVEDRRVRYRLRLGPFLTEIQANAVLGIVREGYPGAFIAAASTEDLESFADIQFDTITAAPAPKPAPPIGSVAAAVPPAAAATLTPSAAKIEPHPKNQTPAAPATTAAPIAAARPHVPPSPTLTHAVVPRRTGMPVSMPLAQMRAASNIASTPPASPPTALAAQVKKEPAAAPMTATAKVEMPQSPKPATAVSKLPPRAASPVGGPTLAQQVSTFLTSMILEVESDDSPQVGGGKGADAPHRQALASRRPAGDRAAIDLESTQTLRALTTAELEDNNQTVHWFAIELSVSDRAFDPDTLPDLDIFSAYRLYVIESKGQCGAIHALRLGFFGEEIAAKAVADYLTDHYQKPTVMRVSNAERERFSERCVEARKRVEATGKHAVIEITDQRYVREVSLIQR